VPIQLSEREPVVAPEDLVDALVPPPTFHDATFASFRPDPAEPSQSEAVRRVRSFAAECSSASVSVSKDRRWFRGRARTEQGSSGVYLDGGFGVGKTHLLAALWHEVEGAKLFATFVELTHLVGVLGFAEAVTRLSAYRLVCIDEFELDDPGDTVLVSTLLARLTEAGVQIAATSNTLPDRLGEGRFAAEDFLREIQALAERFDVVRIDGPDYRHRDLATPADPLDPGRLGELAAGTQGSSYDHWVDLTRHLADVHPSRYAALVDGVRLACFEDVRPLQDQATALRVVVLVDRLYDRDVPVAASGARLDQVFSAEMLAGGFRKKYFRALSRLVALSHASRGPSPPPPSEPTAGGDGS
jgi:cell division protein ZapE